MNITPWPLKRRLRRSKGQKMPEKPGEKFGDLLVKSGLIDELQLQAALGHQRRWGGKLGQCLVDLGFITESELLGFMSDKFKMPAIDLTKSRISDQAFAALPESVAKKYSVVPVFIKEGPAKKKILTLAMSDPSNLKILDEVQFLTGLKVEPVLANESAITRVLEHYGHYHPEEIADSRGRPDIARPSDLRKEHTQPRAAPPPRQPKSAPEKEVELILGGEEPSEGMPEIVDLEEAESEGVEITPDDDVKVVRDEVVMVRADAPAKPRARVWSSTERVPSRAPIREKVGKVPEVESFSPPPAPVPEEKPAPKDDFYRVPDLGMGTPAVEKKATPPKPPVKQKPPARQEISIELPEGGEDEKLEISPAHEFVSWQPQGASEAVSPPAPESESEPAPGAGTAKEIPAFEPQPSTGEERELTGLVKPESAEDDFWAEHEEPSPASTRPGPVLAEEEVLPFEREIEQKLEAVLPSKKPEPPAEPKPKPAGLGSMEDVTGVAPESDIFETPPPAAEEKIEAVKVADEVFGLEGEDKAGPAETTSEMSLEFAFKKINHLEAEIRKKQFQFDELLNLMMKKELGEITTELFMQELNILKQEMEKKKGKKTK